MKGNPIVTAITALAIMLGFFFVMQTILKKPAPTTTATPNPSAKTPHTYIIEAFFASKPNKVTIIDALTNQLVLKIDDLQDTNSIADFTLDSTRNPLELRIIAEFPPAKTRQFITLTLSSETLAPQTHTLHNTGNIDDILTYDWR